MAHREQPAGDLTTWVCVTCGSELYSRGPSAGRLVCPRCRGTVFRQFDSPAPTDEAAEGFLHDTARRLDLGDAAPDTRTPDVQDLNNL